MSSPNIMIHHLHGDGFPNVQGSVSVERISQIMDKYPRCVLTFDDRLPSQELVLDLLDRKGKKAYFFVNHHNEMEQDRMIRESYGDTFYEWFFSQYPLPLPNMPDSFLSQWSFYSPEDKMYRWIKDYSDPLAHDHIMAPKRSEVQLLDLDKIKHHEIGLHSYSHPRDMGALDFKDQFMEYYRLKEIVPHAFSMSHPMGRYNEDTLIILKSLGIRIGFRSDNKAGKTNLELPRIDVNDLDF